MRLLISLFAVVAVSVAQIKTTEATVINYGNLAGSTVSFNSISENPSFNPTATTGLFGTPNAMNNMLSFSPLEFEAAFAGVGSQVRTSTLSSVLAAQPGFLITGFSVEAFGDYGLTIPFSPPGVAQVVASFTGTDLASSSSIAIANSSPGFSASFSPSGLLASFAPTASYNLSLTTSLSASTTSLFNDAFIKLKGYKVTVETQPDGVIPEPTSALIFVGLGLAGLSSRRRR